MQVEFSVAQLGTVAGVGAVTLVLLQLVLKPLLAGLKSSETLARWRGLIINVSALVVALVLAVAAQLVTGIDYETGLQAFLTALGGAVVATSGYEAIKNAANGFRG